MINKIFSTYGSQSEEELIFSFFFVSTLPRSNYLRSIYDIDRYIRIIDKFKIHALLLAIA